ncbi:MAG: mechanosensitive ion channel domain-containing protein [Phycisphaerae bacterium]
MWYETRYGALLQRLGFATCMAACLGFNTDPESPPEPTTAAAKEGDCSELRRRLTDSEQALTDRGAVIGRRLETLTAELDDSGGQNDSVPATGQADRKEELVAERAALQNELKFLEAAETAWQAALDSCQTTARLREELHQAQADGPHEPGEFVAGDVTALQSQLDQIQSAHDASEESNAVRTKRLEEIAEAIEQADKQARPLLEAEQSALLAECASITYKSSARDAERTLLEARLAAAREVVGAVGGPQAEPTVQVQAADEADALNKQRLAEQLDAEARNRLEFTRRRLDAIENELEEVSVEGAEAAELENEREYLKRVESYEQRRLHQAELHKRTGQQKEGIGQVRQRIEEARKTLEQLRTERSAMSLAERRERAANYRQQAEATHKEANALEAQAAAEEKEIEPLQQLLPSLEAVEQALNERLEAAGNLPYSDVARLSQHVRRMRKQLDAERQQVDLMVATTENVVYAKKRRATLMRGLADLHVQCAEVLVPSVPSFWVRQRKIIESIAILGGVIIATYLLQLLIWLVRQIVPVLNAMTGMHLSAKRLGTLLSFAGSIIKLFVWIFGVVAILNQFGVEPSTSTGAIGLIGLIMAGMFQQIVVDFVKGLDIVVGRHYNVGDFVQVDGKYGHVVDFNVKYTRIRTVSGQQLNIPNSRCVPSQRFPDGYVNNYVDIMLKTGADEERAREAIEPTCQDLNQRIEPVREKPALAWRFSGPRDQVTLRYRVRVLPGCGWVVTDHFIPAVKKALAEAAIETVAEPVMFYINRIETFRKLFSRRLSEEEIVREMAQDEQTTEAGESTSRSIQADQSAGWSPTSPE